MKDLKTLLVRARYALEPEDANLQDDLAHALEVVLDAVEHTLRSLDEEGRIELIEEIESFVIQKETPLQGRPELRVVNE